MEIVLTAALRPRCLVAFFGLIFLTGCPSDGERTSTFPKVDPIFLSGIVATGAPIADADVEVLARLVSDGRTERRTTRTDANGRFRVQVNALKPPFLIHVVPSNGETLNSVAFGLDHVNVTPLTELTLLLLAGKSPSIFLDEIRSNPAKFDSFTTSAVAAAAVRVRSQIFDVLGFAIPTGIGDFFTESFEPVAGNPMDDALTALASNLTGVGLTLTSFETNYEAEIARCAKEKVVLAVGGTAAKEFCPISRETNIDATDTTVTNFSFTNALGNTLKVRGNSSAIESVELNDRSGLAFSCAGDSCRNVVIGSLASNGTRTIQFNGTAGSNGAGDTATLQGTVLAARAGLPPVACDGDKVFLSKSDGSVLAGCGSIGAATGGDRLVLDLFGNDADGNTLIFVQAKIRADNGEIVSVTSYKFDESFDLVVDYKCIAPGCNGVSVGTLTEEGTRLISFTDTLLQQVGSDGVPTGPGFALLNHTSIAGIPTRPDPIDCTGSFATAMLQIPGERNGIVCPFFRNGEGENRGFYLDEARTLVQHTWGQPSQNDLSQTISLTLAGNAVKELIFNLEGVSFGCKETSCAGVSVSARDAEGRRNISFSAVQLRELDFGGLPGERVGSLTGVLPTATLDCIDNANCTP
jgi:hypothetical protein